MKYILLIIIIILSILSYYTYNLDTENKEYTETKKRIYTENELKLLNEKDYKYDEKLNIKISEDTFNKYVDIVTDYSLLDKETENKYILIYLATFHLFDMNYSYRSVRQLNDRLIDFPYLSNDIQYPKGSIHDNLQRTIITHITQYIDKSERKFVGDREKDREIIRIYLKNLFGNMEVL